MQDGRDLEQILLVVRDGLQESGVPFDDCGLNLVDKRTDPPSVRSYTVIREGRRIRTGWGRRAEAVLQIWRGQGTVYRQDLDAEDIYGEALYLERGCGHPMRSVVDVPFSHGTLAVGSTQPDAFSQEDLEILKEMARVLSEGFTRLEDLRLLEQRARELEERDGERKRAEEALRESEERYQALLDRLSIGMVLATPEAMQREEALQKVHDELERQVQERMAGLSQTVGILKDQIMERQSAEEHLRNSRDHLRLFSARLLSAQEEERKRISRELHDRTSQSLASLMVGLKTVEMATTLDDVRERIAELRALTMAILPQSDTKKTLDIFCRI